MQKIIDFLTAKWLLAIIAGLFLFGLVRRFV
mgnify:CR=1 FL=1